MHKIQDDARLRIALLGTRGVPARYGGFETCVEEVGFRLAARGHDVTVYCRTPAGEPQRDDYLGMRLVHLPSLKSRTLETLSHTGLSVGHLLGHRVDAAVLFNAANAPWLPVIRAARVPVATHVDGLEWQRAKWGAGGKRYYRSAESLAVRWSDALIADATGIQDYYRTEFDVDTELISYGAPHLDGLGTDRLAEIGLEPQQFHLVVARFEPENHVDLIVDGYRRSGSTRPLVVVGSAPYSDAYTARVHSLADDRVRFLGGVWDQDLLNQLYAHAFLYLHGHSVGGTNPSLLRAIGSGTATAAFDVGFNREVLLGAGRYFRDAGEVARQIEAAESDPDENTRRAAESRVASERYDWNDVTTLYERLARRLVAGEFAGKRSTGRRSATSARAEEK